MLEVFGGLAAGGMVGCYALEERGARFVFAFAGCCLAAAGYAFAIGSWPFFALELAWAGIALRRGLRRVGAPSHPTT